MIFLTEYDERKHLESMYEEGKEDGIEEGRESKLIEQIRKKRARGKDAGTIAEELEEDIETINTLITKYHDR